MTKHSSLAATLHRAAEEIETMNPESIPEVQVFRKLGRGTKARTTRFRVPNLDASLARCACGYTEIRIPAAFNEVSCPDCGAAS